MDMDGWLVLASAVVGLLVGLTGAGGGALMTPMLIFVFGVTPLGRHLERPRGRGGHAAGGRRRPPPPRARSTCPMVGWLTLGSVPAAFAGAYLLQVARHRHGRRDQGRDRARGGPAAWAARSARWCSGPSPPCGTPSADGRGHRMAVVACPRWPSACVGRRAWWASPRWVRGRS